VFSVAFVTLTKSGDENNSYRLTFMKRHGKRRLSRKSVHFAVRVMTGTFQMRRFAQLRMPVNKISTK